MGASKYRWKTDPLSPPGFTDADQVQRDIRDLLYMLVVSAPDNPTASRLLRAFEQRRREVIEGDGH